MSADDRCSFCGKREGQFAWLVAASKMPAARRIVDTLNPPNKPR